MPSIHAILGIIAGILSIIPVIPYVRSILKGDTKPERASWIIWLIVGLLLCASYFASGARETIWVPVSYVLFPLIVLPFALRYGEGGLQRFDIFCLVGAAAGLVLWIFTRDPAKALYINAAIDIIGYLPTIRKTYKNPLLEDKTTWILASSAAFLNILAISNWMQFQVFFYPIYIFGFEFIVTLLCFGLFPGQKKLVKS